MAIAAEALEKMKEHVPQELSADNIVKWYLYWHYKMEAEREIIPKWYEEANKALEEYRRKNDEKS